jgi:hypothetical protein
MSIVIDLADYRDITPKEEEIRLPEDGFIQRALSVSGSNAAANDLVEAHKLLSLAALRGSPKARVERIKLSRRMTSHQVSQAQEALGDYLDARSARHGLTGLRLLASDCPIKQKAASRAAFLVSAGIAARSRRRCYLSNQVQGGVRPPGMCREWSSPTNPRRHGHGACGRFPSAAGPHRC